MTTAEARERVASIERSAGDPEGAHSMEDAFWADVLKAIADGAENASALAEIALTTNDLEFSRWYA